MRWLAVALLAATVAGADEPWLDAGGSHDTRVWYRDLPLADAREIKAETTIAATPERVWEVLSDIEHYPEFMPYLVEIRRLESADGSYVLYERVEPPLISARDYTLRLTLQEDAKARVFRRSWSLANDLGPAIKDGTVRVTVNEGAYDLRADAAGGARLTYTLRTNPGGSIPLWIARRASTSSVPDLLDAIRHRALDPAWKR